MEALHGRSVWAEMEMERNMTKELIIDYPGIPRAKRIKRYETLAMPDCHTVINIDMKVITKKHS